ARGLLSQILSLPEKWDMTISGLSKINRECSDTIASIIKELEATGYITRYRERRKNGTYGEIFYDIRMKPRHFDDPKRKKSERVKPKQMSSAQLSKEKSNKEKENKELFNIHQSILPDGIDKIDGYRAIILENIEYDLIVDQYNKAQLDEIVDIMLECVCSEAETQNIGRDKVPTELVKNRILKLDSMHIEYIFSCLKENPSKVRNIKSYLKTVLYNAGLPEIP
ncbi:MAG: helix-turn-helix domain-containing protein, partial [Oscillospiraceae bacterium]|nr:helix-turn-helix domain-containing protein [Oscillospiraceae bacterium]